MKKLSRLIFPALILCLFLALAAKAEIRKIERFDNGWLIYRAWVDENNNPAMGDEGYSSMVLKLDSAYRPLLVSYYDTDGKPINLPAGYSSVSKKYTGYGWIIEEAYYDAAGKPVVPEELGYARLLNTYKGSKLISVEHFGVDGGYIVPEGLFAKRVDAYNTRGLLARREFFDASGARMLGEEGYMAGIGIGLRQVCDFAVFVNQVGPEAWQKNIGPVLRRCGLLRFAEILAKACVLFLGLPQSRAPWCEQADAGLSRALLEEFLNSGNFGNKQSSQRASSILSADKAGSGHQSRMPTLVIRNINAYARKNYRLARRFPISLPFFWFYLPLKFLVSKRGSGESASPLRLLLEGRRRKRLFDALEVFKPDTGG